MKIKAILTALLGAIALASPLAMAVEKDTSFTSCAQTKKILFIAGAPSHGHGEHEHRAGCMLLADALNNSKLPVEAKVHWYNWPKDHSVFDNVDLTVIYADAAGKMDQNILDLMDTRVKKGMGIMFMHYGVHPTVAVGEKYMMPWTGAFFKNGKSVNPHWIADITALKNHPVSNGVAPFRAEDEFYFNMQKDNECEHCLALASATPQAEDITNHNNLWNDQGKAALGTSQALMWARDPQDGAGRGIGWVGGHYHHNWAIDDFRTLTLNAIVWASRTEVPKGGVPSVKITKRMLNKNLDRASDKLIELPFQK